MNKARKPDIYWVEGVLVFFERPFPHDQSDPRRVGFEVGQKIIGLYLTELLLKYALDGRGVAYRNVHDLRYLYRKLPAGLKKRARQKYDEMLHNRWEWTWSFARTLDSFVKHLGKNPLRDARYFWRRDYSSRPQLLSPGNLHTLVYALFTSLHGYPQNSLVVTRRYETRFVDFEKSLTSGSGGRSDRAREKEPLGVHWLEGFLDCYRVEFPYGSDDPRGLGFSVARQIVGLHLVELLLKYALEGLGIGYARDHDLGSLFRALPEEIRDLAERKYAEILASAREAWEFARSIESLLAYLGKDPVTESRYFWEPREYREGGASILFSQGTVEMLIYALFISLHGYPERHDEERSRFVTRFVPFEPSGMENSS